MRASVAGSASLVAGLYLALIALAATPTDVAASGAGTLGGPARAAVTRPDPAGELLFRAKGCAGCHSIASRGIRGTEVGPDLSRLAEVAPLRRPGMSAEDYLRESIAAPRAFVVPEYAGATFGMPDLKLREHELRALAAFLLGTR